MDRIAEHHAVRVIAAIMEDTGFTGLQKSSLNRLKPVPAMYLRKTAAGLKEIMTHRKKHSIGLDDCQLMLSEMGVNLDHLLHFIKTHEVSKQPITLHHPVHKPSENPLKIPDIESLELSSQPSYIADHLPLMRDALDWKGAHKRSDGPSKQISTGDEQGSFEKKGLMNNDKNENAGRTKYPIEAGRSRYRLRNVGMNDYGEIYCQGSCEKKIASASPPPMTYINPLASAFQPKLFRTTRPEHQKPLASGGRSHGHPKNGVVAPRLDHRHDHSTANASSLVGVSGCGDTRDLNGGYLSPHDDLPEVDDEEDANPSKSWPPKEDPVTPLHPIEPAFKRKLNECRPRNTPPHEWPNSPNPTSSLNSQAPSSLTTTPLCSLMYPQSKPRKSLSDRLLRGSAKKLVGKMADSPPAGKSNVAPTSSSSSKPSKSSKKAQSSKRSSSKSSSRPKNKNYLKEEQLFDSPLSNSNFSRPQDRKRTFDNLIESSRTPERSESRLSVGSPSLNPDQLKASSSSRYKDKNKSKNDRATSVHSGSKSKRRKIDRSVTPDTTPRPKPNVSHISPEGARSGYVSPLPVAPAMATTTYHEGLAATGSPARNISLGLSSDEEEPVSIRRKERPPRSPQHVSNKRRLSEWEDVPLSKRVPSTNNNENGGSSRKTSTRSDPTREMAREAQAREAQAREAQAREAQAREAQAREAQAREAQAREAQAREAQAREAQAREAQAREAQAREAEAKEAQAREDEARDDTELTSDVEFDEDDEEFSTEDIITYGPDLKMKFNLGKLRRDSASGTASPASTTAPPAPPAVDSTPAPSDKPDKPDKQRVEEEEEYEWVRTQAMAFRQRQNGTLSDGGDEFGLRFRGPPGLSPSLPDVDAATDSTTVAADLGSEERRDSADSLPPPSLMPTVPLPKMKIKKIKGTTASFMTAPSDQDAAPAPRTSGPRPARRERAHERSKRRPRAARSPSPPLLAPAMTPPRGEPPADVAPTLTLGPAGDVVESVVLEQSEDERCAVKKYHSQALLPPQGALSSSGAPDGPGPGGASPLVAKVKSSSGARKSGGSSSKKKCSSKRSSSKSRSRPRPRPRVRPQTPPTPVRSLTPPTPPAVFEPACEDLGFGFRQRRPSTPSTTPSPPPPPPPVSPPPVVVPRPKSKSGRSSSAHASSGGSSRKGPDAAGATPLAGAGGGSKSKKAATSSGKSKSHAGGSKAAQPAPSGARGGSDVGAITVASSAAAKSVPAHPAPEFTTMGVNVSHGSSYYFDSNGTQIWICPKCHTEDNGSLMIGCDACDDWYHGRCLGIFDEPDEEVWYCPHCVNKIKSNVTKRKKKSSKSKGRR